MAEAEGRRPTFSLPFRAALEPDPQYNDAATMQGQNAAIVIDNGSHHLRAGWSTEDAPRLDFVNLAARYRSRPLNEQVTQVGSDLNYAEAARLVRSPFEQNVVCSFDVMEDVLDHTFSRLGIRDSSVASPVVMTEAYCTPNFSRKLMNELLFEGYGVPLVSYGVDALFSYYYNTPAGGAVPRTSLVVASGHQATHILPVVNDLLTPHGRRIDIGGFTYTTFLSRLVQLKYPLTTREISTFVFEDLCREHCYFADDVNEDFNRAVRPETFDELNRVVMISTPPPAAGPKSEEEQERLAKMRKEQGRRLQEQAAKKRAEKLDSQQKELDSLVALANLAGSKGAKLKEFNQHLSKRGFTSVEQLQQAIAALEGKVRQARNRELGIVTTETKERPVFDLIDIPDSQLDEAQIKEKRKQRLLKAGMDARDRARLAKEEQKAEEESAAKAEEQRYSENPDAFLQEKRKDRKEILNRLRERKRLKTDLTNRRSAASQQRMRSLAALASESKEDSANERKRKRTGKQSEKEDTFGAQDSDWMIYREISKEEDSDEEDEDMMSLHALETTIAKFDPSFVVSDLSSDAFLTDNQSTGSLLPMLRYATPSGDIGPLHQYEMHLNIERFRVPEILYDPTICGLDQSGLARVIQMVLENYKEPQRAAMSSDVFVTGGAVLQTGFRERLQKELTSIRPFKSVCNIRRASDPQRDAWRGAAKYSRDLAADMSKIGITRQQFDEMGHDYLTEHQWSSPYFRVPS